MVRVAFFSRNQLELEARPEVNQRPRICGDRPLPVGQAPLGTSGWAPLPPASSLRPPRRPAAPSQGRSARLLRLAHPARREEGNVERAAEGTGRSWRGRGGSAASRPPLDSAALARSWEGAQGRREDQPLRVPSRSPERARPRRCVRAVRHPVRHLHRPARTAPCPRIRPETQVWAVCLFPLSHEPRGVTLWMAQARRWVPAGQPYPPPPPRLGSYCPASAGQPPPPAQPPSSQGDSSRPESTPYPG